MTGGTARVVKYSLKLDVACMAEHILVSHSDAVSSAVGRLKAGSVIAIPTDTLYGLACDATNSNAIHQLYSIKRRHEHKPVALCFGEISDVKLWANVSHLPSRLLHNLLPGPVTLIFNSLNKIDSSLCSKKKVGIRIPDYMFVRNVAKSLGRPLALTSANLSNEPSAISPREFQVIWDKISAVYDGGITNINRSGSTIVDLSELGLYQIIREGVAFKEVVDILRKFDLKEKI